MHDGKSACGFNWRCVRICLFYFAFLVPKCIAMFFSPLQASEMEISGTPLPDELPDAPASGDAREPGDAKSLR